MGVVYLAAQVSLDRPIALKLIAPERARGPGVPRALPARVARRRVDRPPERRPGPRGRRGGRRAVRGDALRRGLGPRRTAPRERAAEPERAARIVAQIGDALDAAHARGLVHRDVKPANVLVADPAGAEHCYLTDFGLTKQTVTTEAALTQPGAVMGTVAVHGAGAVARRRGGRAHRRLRARLRALRAAGGRAAVRARHRHRDAVRAPVGARRPKLGGPFDEVVGRALEKDPAQRFQSAGDLGRAALLAAREPGGATEPAPKPPSQRPRRRRRWVVAAAAAAVRGRRRGGARDGPAAGRRPRDRPADRARRHTADGDGVRRPDLDRARG